MAAAASLAAGVAGADPRDGHDRQGRVEQGRFERGYAAEPAGGRGTRAYVPRRFEGAPEGPREPHGPGEGRYAPYVSPYGGAAPVFGGEWRQQQDFLRQGVRRGQLAPLGEVIRNIHQMTPGRQLDANLEYAGPRLVYRVRWMTDQGRRVDYIVDAATGAIISER